VYCVRDEGVVEVKPMCGAAAYGRHRENEVWCGTEAWAKDAEPSSGKSELCDVNCIIGDVVSLE
jgi:hypothetical protein